MESDLRVATFNMLAPCYKRVKGRDVNAREAANRDRYLERHTKIVDLLKNLNADVICLQVFGHALT